MKVFKDQVKFTLSLLLLTALATAQTTVGHFPEKPQFARPIQSKHKNYTACFRTILRDMKTN